MIKLTVKDFSAESKQLPEMESSKALAKILKKQIFENDNVLDVGCGCGHYLKSLLSEIGVPFKYTGVDATNYYIELAKKPGLNILVRHFILVIFLIFPSKIIVLMWFIAVMFFFTFLQL